jgi:hypothetical protein
LESGNVDLPEHDDVPCLGVAIALVTPTSLPAALARAAW